GYDPETGTWG
nr:Chain A, Chignolin [synthetic construct]